MMSGLELTYMTLLAAIAVVFILMIGREIRDYIRRQRSFRRYMARQQMEHDDVRN